MTDLRTPVLGIASEHDRANAQMLAVACGSPGAIVWTYVIPQVGRNVWKPLSDESEFMPLGRFGCQAYFTPSGKLTIVQWSTYSRARYANGRMRSWQGEPQETIRIHHDVARYVHEVIETEDDLKAMGKRADVETASAST